MGGEGREGKGTIRREGNEKCVRGGPGRSLYLNPYFGCTMVIRNTPIGL